MVRFKKYLKK